MQKNGLKLPLNSKFRLICVFFTSIWKNTFNFCKFQKLPLKTRKIHMKWSPHPHLQTPPPPRKDPQDPLITCKYDPCHRILRSRLDTHYMKCGPKKYVYNSTPKQNQTSRSDLTKIGEKIKENREIDQNRGKNWRKSGDNRENNILKSG